jgi:hypothetical protein
VARAPYNFIPLNEKVVPAQSICHFDSFDSERLSGFISIEIKTITPLFIRGNKENFLNPNNRLIIQGSSIRGMIRNLVEVFTCSKFRKYHQYEDRRMYFRAMADGAKRLKELYEREINENIEAGYLKYDPKDKKYLIKPSSGYETIPYESNKKFKYIKSGDCYEVHSGPMNGKKKNWKILPPSQEQCLPVDPDVIKAYQEDINRSDRVFNIVEIAREGKFKELKFDDGVPVFYKREDDKVTSFGHTRNYRLPYPKYISDHIPEELGKEDVLDISEAIFGRSGKNNSQIIAGRVYFEDSLPRNFSEINIKTTALKILASPKPTTFQHYLKQKKGIYTKLSELEHWGDASAVIRGYKYYWHRANPNPNNIDSTLWLENSLDLRKKDIDRWLTENPKKKEIWESFKLDIKKDSNDEEKINIKWNLIQNKTKLIALLVEYYNLDNSVFKKLNLSKPQNSIVNMVSENEIFQSRIRFENLTDVELGALLFALDLPDGCAHKLGMGKPLGLGTIKITPKLTLINRDTRYQNIFDKDGSWVTGEEFISDISKYKNKFTEYIGKNYNNKNIVTSDDYWSKDSRLQELKYLLSIDEKMKEPSWKEKTRYMLIKNDNDNDNDNNKNEFKERPVLPRPSEVINSNLY